jgi:hypothetical protein
MSHNIDLDECVTFTLITQARDQEDEEGSEEDEDEEGEEDVHEEDLVKRA